MFSPPQNVVSSHKKKCSPQSVLPSQKCSPQCVLPSKSVLPKVFFPIKSVLPKVFFPQKVFSRRLERHFISNYFVPKNNLHFKASILCFIKLFLPQKLTTSGAIDFQVVFGAIFYGGRETSYFYTAAFKLSLPLPHHKWVLLLSP